MMRYARHCHLLLSLVVVCGSVSAAGQDLPPLYRDHVLLPHDSNVASVAFSSSGDLLAAGDRLGAIRLWDVKTKGVRLLGRHGIVVLSLAFGADDMTVVTGAWEQTDEKKSVGTVKIWAVKSGKELATFRGHADVLSGMALSSDRNMLASASVDGIVKLWDLESHKKLRSFQGHDKGPLSLSFSPDGSTLAVGGEGQGISEPGSVKLWKVSEATPDGTLIGRSSKALRVQYAPHGKLLATGSSRWCQLWEMPSRKAVLEVTCYGTIYSVNFSPDGKLLAVGGTDGLITLYEVASGKRRVRLLNDGQYGCTSFSPDGLTLASSGRRGVMLWDIRKALTHRESK